MTIQVKREKLGEAMVVSVGGSVDIYSSPELRGELKVALDGKVSRLVIDLGGVSFVDSSGLATLIEALQKVQGYGGKLFLCNISPKVLGVFQLANLDHIFQIRDTRDGAIKG
ncbi:MAG: STAS domain-containing protein [Planctomycetota bacterium]